MKKYIKSLAFLFLTLVFVGCGVDDDDPTINNSQPTVTINLGTTGEIVATTPGTETINIVMSASLSTDTKVTYNHNGQERVAIVPAGSSVYGLDFPSGLGIFHEIELTGATGLYSVARIGNDKSVSILGIPTPDPNNIQVLMLNDSSDDPGDIWMGLSSFTSGGAWIEDFEGSLNSQYPRVTFVPLDGAGAFGNIPNTADIAPDFLAINLFVQGTINDPTNFNIYVVHPDGSFQSFTGSISEDRKSVV